MIWLRTNRSMMISALSGSSRGMYCFDMRLTPMLRIASRHTYLKVSLNRSDISPWMVRVWVTMSRSWESIRFGVSSKLL